MVLENMALILEAQKMYEETQLSFSSGLVMDLPMALMLSYGL
jgi:hypothetical protein